MLMRKWTQLDVAVQMFQDERHGLSRKADILRSLKTGF